MNPKFFGPLLQKHRASVVLNSNGISSICCLVFPAGPATVTRFVVAIIVRITVERIIRRALAHICKKVLKLSPLLADLYSSTSVVVPIRMVFIGTPSQHVCP